MMCLVGAASPTPRKLCVLYSGEARKSLPLQGRWPSPRGRKGFCPFAAVTHLPDNLAAPQGGQSSGRRLASLKPHRLHSARL